MDALNKSLSEISAKIRAMWNALVPVNRLPIEILQQIPPRLPHPWDIVGVSHVCRHWRTAFLSYPDLRAFLDCKPEYATHPFLQRSQSVVSKKEDQSEGAGPPPDRGTWKDGNHIVGRRNNRLEQELFGKPNDPPRGHSGIDLEKCGDIPFEVTGSGVPEPIATFADSPLDPVLLENISYARCTVLTPIQRYLVPIMAAGKDLVSCVQVRPPSHLITPGCSPLGPLDRLR